MGLTKNIPHLLDFILVFHESYKLLYLIVMYRKVSIYLKDFDIKVNRLGLIGLLLLLLHTFAF